jgi:NAD(P)-dependent dehydrogenase (short-subunit alcohol dehydrogenase family)
MKTVVISGCTRGLGYSMVKEFIDLGWRVAGCGRNLVSIESLKAEFSDLHYFEMVDVSSDEQVRNFANVLMSRIATPDLVLNNAAIINNNAPLWEVPDEEFSKLLDINIKGVASMIRYLVPEMIKRGSGVIVNFSSGWGRSTSPEVAPYCASKWAIEGLSQALAQELPSGMASIALNPGIINTDMLQSCFGSGASAYPTADQWAKTAVRFLANRDASSNGRALTAP